MVDWKIIFFIGFLFLVIGIFVFIPSKKPRIKTPKKTKTSKKTIKMQSQKEQKESISTEEKKELLENVQEIVRSHPKTSSQIIKKWLKE